MAVLPVVIAVQQSDQVASGSLDAEIASSAHAGVGGCIEDLDEIGMRLCVPCNDRECIVGGAIVHHHNLLRLASLSEH